MSKQTLFNKPVFLLLPILAMLFIGVFSASRAGFTTNTMEQMRLDLDRKIQKLRVEDIKLQNKTKGIKVLSMEKEGDIIKLELKNVSGKTITAYQVAVANMTTYTECLTGSEYTELFLPEESREQSYALQDQVDTMGIKILAAIYEDGTDDGDRQYLKEMRQYRAGMKVYREKALALLNALPKSKSISIESALTDIEANLPQVSEEEKEKMSYFVRMGTEDEESRFLKLLRNLNNGREVQMTNKDIREIKKQKLNRVIENYRRTLPQL